MPDLRQWREVCLAAQCEAAPTRWTAPGSRRAGNTRSAKQMTTTTGGTTSASTKSISVTGGVPTQPCFTLKFKVTESTNGVAVPFSTSGA